MSVKLDSINELKKYFLGVVKRSEHHAPNVSDIVYSLLGAIILLKDEDTSLEVRGSEDVMANIIWVQINNNRFALRYEHDDDTIEIRQNTFKGEILLKVDNSTTITEMLNTFKNVNTIVN